jgi:hypothetical protein
MRGYGRMDGGRTDGRMSGGRTNGRMVFKKRFSALFESYPRFIQKDKTRIWSKKLFQPFLSHIRVLSKRIKRGYGPKTSFSRF